MKYIKKYEDKTEDYKFKPGDIVVCIINRNGYVAKYGEKYIVKESGNFSLVLRYFNVNKIIKKDGKIRRFYSGNFVPEYIWNSKKYNI